MKRKKQQRWQTLLTVLLALFVVFYVGYQAYRSVYSKVETELATVHSVYESIEATGLVYRAETVISESNSGHVYYEINNGTRVSKGSVIASVYGDSRSGRIEQEMEAIDQQIAAFKTIQADASSERVTLDVINEQTRSAFYRLIQATESGALDGVDSAHFDILSLLSKKQLVTGKTIDFSKKIKELEDKKSSLKAQYHQPKSKVYAPVAGYFADQTDGFESILKTDDLAKLSVETLQTQLAAQPVADATSGGKIVSGYEWYLACVLPDRYYNALGVGKHLSLRLPFVLGESVPATVYSCNKDNNGNIAVVFRCDYMSAELSTIRKESVEIQLVEHTGLKVPKRAIIIGEDQQAGVYIRSGNVVSFRKIQQVFSDPAEYSICEEVLEDGYLRMYDDIIVGGRDLYDGKIIS